MGEMNERAKDLNKLLEERGSGFTVVFNRVWKNNEGLESYTLVSADRKCCPMLYKGSWYDSSDEEVVAFLEKVFRENTLDFDTSKFLNPDYILQHVYPRLVSADFNLDMIREKKYVFMPFLDLLILFYVDLHSVIDRSIENGEFFTSLLTENVLKQLNLSLDDVYFHAIANAEERITITSMKEALDAMLADEDMDGLPIDDTPMFILSNSSANFGAASLLCPSAMELIRDKVGVPFIVLPSSVHECIVIPYSESENIDHLRDMVRCVNDTQVAQQDRLSYSLYSCDDEGRLYQL